MSNVEQQTEQPSEQKTKQEVTQQLLDAAGNFPTPPAPLIIALLVITGYILFSYSKKPLFSTAMY